MIGATICNLLDTDNSSPGSILSSFCVWTRIRPFITVATVLKVCLFLFDPVLPTWFTLLFWVPNLLQMPPSSSLKSGEEKFFNFSDFDFHWRLEFLTFILWLLTPLTCRPGSFLSGSSSLSGISLSTSEEVPSIRYPAPSSSSPLLIGCSTARAAKS